MGMKRRSSANGSTTMIGFDPPPLPPPPPPPLTNCDRNPSRRRKPRSAFSSFYNGTQDRAAVLKLIVFSFVSLVLLFTIISKISGVDDVDAKVVAMMKSNKKLTQDVDEKVRAMMESNNKLREGNTLDKQQRAPKERGWIRNTLQRINSRYAIPGSIPQVGDKSTAYAKLRQAIDQTFPPNADRSRARIKELHKRTYDPIAMNATDRYDIYDIHNCPYEPPKGYPYAWNMMDVLNHWPPDDPTPRPSVYQGLCVFDFQYDYERALHYRSKELPFVVQNDPSVSSAAERWNHPGYMEDMLGNTRYRTEFSENNHFMYWVPPKKNRKNANRDDTKPDDIKDKEREQRWREKGFTEEEIAKKTKNRIHAIDKPANWSQPTTMMRMSYSDWMKHANVTDDLLGPDRPHWYYRLIGCGEQGNCEKDSSEYLFDELTFFQPKPSIYMVQPKKQKGIHCRFGMKGVIAENHFDGSRNAIVLLGGERRYILSHPDQCEKLALLPKSHPSGRHSAIDWAAPDLESYPEFREAETNEVILQAGDALYLPTHWFHYIISLELNFQCNTRSGVSNEYGRPIHACGF